VDWFILAIAIIAEVTATAALKLSKGFTRLWPSVAVVCFFSLALYLLSLTLDTLPLGVVYAIWSGSGVALISLVGHYFFKQVLDLPALIGIGLIVSGVVCLRLFSGTAALL
jgi:small multidrug resistance pump